MATHTLYPTNTLAITPNFWSILQDGGTAPTAANSTYGWSPSKQALSNTIYMGGHLGASGAVTAGGLTSFIDSTTSPTKGTGTTGSTAGDSFIAGPYTGTFANTAWTFAWNMRASTAGVTGRLRMRVWKSANADGTSATALTASTQVGSTIVLSTTVDTNSSMSWSPGTITLSNEYLFFQMEWEQTAVGTTSGDNALFRIGTASITTPDLGAGAAAGSLVWNPQPFQHMLVR